MVDLCLHWTSRSLGSTVELCRKLANLCQVSVFPCFLVYDYNDCAYAVYHPLTVLAVSSGAELPSVLPVPNKSCFAFSFARFVG